MKSTILVILLSSFFSNASLSDGHPPLLDPELMRGKTPAKSDNAIIAAASSPSADEVGDVDSFNRFVKWAGLGQTIGVTADGSCTPDPFNRCIPTSSGGAFVSFDERDLETIVLPKKTAHSMICHHITPFYTYQFFNGTGSQQSGALLFLTPYITVYNDVLNDPSLINPTTGLPFGGQFDQGMAMTTIQDRTLEINERLFERQNYSRHCISGLLSKRDLMGVWGLSEAQAKQFFKNDTKIVFNLRGQHNYIDFAQFFYGIRLTVD